MMDFFRINNFLLFCHMRRHPDLAKTFINSFMKDMLKELTIKDAMVGGGKNEKDALRMVRGLLP
ncbi:MAG: hypothetical protein GTO56_38960 [Candidatus Aminicenantes bacterium]|nr:hypothetical protein [Candidatus Aminicenantes bacterium]